VRLRRQPLRLSLVLLAMMGLGDAATHAAPPPIAASDVVYPPVFAPAQDNVTYYLEIRARTDAAFGHAFMVIDAVDTHGASQQVAIFGFVTAAGAPDGLNAIFGSVGEVGYSTDDINAELAETFRVRINRATYPRIAAAVRDMQKSWTTYDLLSLNCNTFIATIARSIGLFAPTNSALPPATFVRDLKRLNTTDKPTIVAQ
jgi:hypothetical protein